MITSVALILMAAIFLISIHSDPEKAKENEDNYRFFFSVLIVFAAMGLFT